MVQLGPPRRTTMSAGESEANEPSDVVSENEHGYSRTYGNAIPKSATDKKTSVSVRSENGNDDGGHDMRTVAVGVSAKCNGNQDPSHGRRMSVQSHEQVGRSGQSPDIVGESLPAYTGFRHGHWRADLA